MRLNPIRSHDGAGSRTLGSHRGGHRECQLYLQRDSQRGRDPGVEPDSEFTATNSLKCGFRRTSARLFQPTSSRDADRELLCDALCSWPGSGDGRGAGKALVGIDCCLMCRWLGCQLCSRIGNDVGWPTGRPPGRPGASPGASPLCCVDCSTIDCPAFCSTGCRVRCPSCRNEVLDACAVYRCALY